MAENQPVIKVREEFTAAIAVKDLEKTVEFLTRYFGIWPWRRFDVDRKVTYKGKPAAYTGPRAIYESGPFSLMVDLSEGTGQQVDFVKRTGGGPNQLITHVEDVDAAVAKLEKAGIPVLMGERGENGKWRWAFMDTMKASGGNIPCVEVGAVSKKVAAPAMAALADNQSVIKARGTFEIAIAVKDVGKTVEFLTHYFGIGPWRRWEVDRPVIYKGKQTRYTGLRANYKFGPHQIQVGQNEGEGQMIDFVKRTGGGLNQLILMMDDVDMAVAKLEKAGIPVQMGMKNESGKWVFAFMDTLKASGGNFPCIEVGPVPRE
ncbi:VOC family protein [Chloroflexota bacterium]